jgi:hypothetical protein
MGGLCSTYEMKNAYKILVGNLKEEPLWRSNHIWEDNIKMDLKEIGPEVVDWIHLAQNTDQWRVLLNMIMGFRVL